MQPGASRVPALPRGFTRREDLVYRNRVIGELTRIDT